MELKYTPRTVKEIEDVAKKPMVEAIGDFSMGTILLFVRKGLDCDENEAYKAIEKYLAIEGNDTMSLYFHILEVLQKLGFIPKSIDLKEMQKSIDTMEV